MKKTVLVATLISFGLGAAAVGTAIGQTTDTPPAAAAIWMPMGNLIAKLEAQGYEVVEIERDGAAYEVEMRDANGFEVEAYFDGTTGEPVSHDDDEREDYDD